MSDKLWGVVENGVWREIPKQPLLSAGWVTDHFWEKRPDGKTLFIVEKPE